MASTRRKVGASASDHDLLIRLDTKLDILTEQVKELTHTATSRISVLEQEKVSRAELENQFKSCPGSLIHAESIRGISKRQEDHEKRLRFTERFVAGAVGVLTVIQILSNFSVIKELF